MADLGSKLNPLFDGPVTDADRVALADGSTVQGGLSKITGSLEAVVVGNPAVFENARINADGTVTTAANGYRYAYLQLPALANSIRVTARPTGTGNYLATWYSDAAGTVFLAHSVENGGSPFTQYTDYVVAVPAGAAAVKVNGATSQAIVLATVGIVAAQKVVDRIGAVEGVAAATATLVSDYPLVATALTAPSLMATARTDGSRLGTDGSITVAAGYSLASAALPAGVKSLNVTATVVGTGNPLLVWYSDAAGTVFLARSAESGGAGGGTAYASYSVAVPAGALAVKIAGTPASAITAYSVGIVTAVGPRLSAAEASAATSAALAGDVPPIRTSLLETVKAVPALTNNARLAADGSVVAASNGYTNSLLAVTSAVRSITVTTSVIGTGGPLLIWYSDALGTTFLSRSAESGGASALLYANYSLTVPAGAQSVRVAGTTSTSTSIATIQIGSNVAGRVAALEGAGTADIAASLYAYQDQAIAVVTDFTVNPDGSFAGAAGYSYAKYPLTGNEKAIRASGTVVGAGRYFATYYSDAACTQYLSRELVGGSGSGTVYANQALTPPAAARGVAINSRVNSPIALQFYGIDAAIGEKIKLIGATVSTWKGKKAAWLGDSITAQYLWQPLLVAKFGFSASVNCGLAGSDVSKPDVVDPTTGIRTSMCDDARINAIPIDSDLVTFKGGVNDHGHSKPLGAITPAGATAFDNTTFYGALETVATKLLARFPGSQRILWFTPTFTDRGTAPSGWADPYTNQLGLTIFDYAKATRAVAQKYGFPVVDLLFECGWNKYNIATFVTNESGVYVHPNSGAGAVRMAEVISGRLTLVQQIAA